MSTNKSHYELKMNFFLRPVGVSSPATAVAKVRFDCDVVSPAVPADDRPGGIKGVPTLEAPVDTLGVRRLKLIRGNT